MATLAPLDAVRFETIAKQSAALLDEILNAKTREAVAAAQERALKHLLDLIDTGDICVNDARNMRVVQDMVAAEHLRNLPEPGAPQLVGRFGVRS